MGIYFFLNLSGLFEQFMEKKKEKIGFIPFVHGCLLTVITYLSLVRVCLKLPNLKCKQYLFNYSVYILFCLKWMGFESWPLICVPGLDF